MEPQTQIPADPPGPCVDGATILLGKRCVEGVWGELGWILTTELEGQRLTMVADAMKQGWKPAEVLKLSEALKPCKCGK